MRAISLWQPYASAVAVGAKRIETRGWATTYRGPLAIHAAKRLESKHPWDLDQQLIIRLGTFWRLRLPRGAVVAVATLSGCLPTEVITPHRVERIFGNFEPGHFGWILTDVRPLPHPIPYIGRQRFFEVPDELLRAAV